MASKFEYLTTGQVASKLQVHQITVYRWIKQGKLKSRRLPNGGYRIEAEEVEKMLSSEEDTNG